MKRYIFAYSIYDGWLLYEFSYPLTAEADEMIDEIMNPCITELGPWEEVGRHMGEFIVESVKPDVFYEVNGFKVYEMDEIEFREEVEEDPWDE